MDSQHRQVIAVAACGSMDARPVLRKLQAVLGQHGRRAEFWGWQRGSDEGHHSTTTRVLLRGGGEANSGLWWRYILWMLRLFQSALTQKAPTVWLCSDLDTALPIYLATRFRRMHTWAFFNLDNFALRYRWPTAVRWVVGRIERHVGLRSAVLIVPGASRWKEDRQNLRIVRNTPTSDQIIAARTIASTRRYAPPLESFSIYVTGWLTATRGLETILACARLLGPAGLRFVVAGKPLCAAAEDLLGLPYVEYLGELSSEEALATYYRCHICITLYDPAVPINRVAEPNKWQDCIITGTPFIANTGIVTITPFVDAGACITVPYGDPAALTAALVRLAADRAAWWRLKDGIRQLHAVPWDDQVWAALEPVVGNGMSPSTPIVSAPRSPLVRTAVTARDARMTDR